jgi:PAS domain S-box-containing protein
MNAPDGQLLEIECLRNELEAVQKKLRDHEERWELVLQGTNEGIWDLKIATGELFISRPWTALLGYEEHEVINRIEHWVDLIHPEDQARVVQCYEDYVAGKIAHYAVELRIKRKDGSYQWMLSRGKLLRDQDGNPIRLAGSNTDISQRKCAEAELTESEQLLRSLIDVMPDLIFFKDCQGIYRLCNQAFQEFVGRPREEILGKTDFELFEPEMASFFRQKDQIMFEKATSQRNEEWVTFADGRLCCLETVKTPVLNERGEVRGLIGLSRDITDRHREEQKLQAEIRERQKAEQALQIYLHIVSHDLRNPVLGMAMILKNFLKNSTLVSEISLPRPILERMFQSCDRQLALINSLVESQHFDTKGIILNRQSLDFSQLLHQLAAEWEPILKQNQAQLNLNIPDPLPLLTADSNLLWRVLENLLANALKHNTSHLTITIQVELRDQSLYCQIQDNGVGIHPDLVDSLFERYQRGKNTGKTPGLGLGLYLCRQIIEAHDGQIALIPSSEGATFAFCLPQTLR